jgi:lipopolysaccharide/colanic/teichoic acid biosynthesis glycosyltransferase
MTNPTVKRAYDLFCSTVGLVVLSPVLLLAAVLVKLSDGGPVFFRQQRVGLNGQLFRISKFRTMVVNAEKLGLSLTQGGDARITPLGGFLRRTKLDELPQLWNVWRGDMSLVGPRPEVPRYVELYTPAQREILKLKPGITDPASLAFRDEEATLSGRAVADLERYYVEHCMPRKIELSLAYARQANVRKDTWIILQTLLPRTGSSVQLRQAETKS